MFIYHYLTYFRAETNLIIINKITSKMHTDLAPHLHSEKCNELIHILRQCQQEHPFRRLFGYCNDADNAMIKCLKEERLKRRKNNYEKSLETKAKLQKLFEQDRQKSKQEAK